VYILYTCIFIYYSINIYVYIYICMHVYIYICMHRSICMFIHDHNLYIDVIHKVGVYVCVYAYT